MTSLTLHTMVGKQATIPHIKGMGSKESIRIILTESDTHLSPKTEALIAFNVSFADSQSRSKIL